MRREEIREKERKFLETLQKLQEKDVRYLIAKHRSLLPRHAVVGSFARVQNLIFDVIEGVEYFIVVSPKGSIIGLIKDSDLIYLLLAGETRYSTFPPMAKLAIRRHRVPIEEAAKFLAEEVMRKGPATIKPDEKVWELLELMRRNRAHTIIIINEEERPLAVIDEETFLRIIKEELEGVIKGEKSSGYS